MSEKFDSEDRLHLFNPVIARRYGLESAVIYQYIRWVCGKRGHFSVTRKSLLQRFPYVGRDGISAALKRLLHPQGPLAPALLVRTDAHTDPTYMLTAKAKTDLHLKRKEKLHGFDPEMAMKYGIPAAIVYDDICRWIVLNEDEDGTEVPSEHYETPRQWAAAHPHLSLRTVERAFLVLKKNREIHCTGYVRKRVPSWLVTDDKLKRYLKLHVSTYARRKPRKSREKIVYKYVPVLNDPDLCGEGDEKFHRQTPSTYRQIPSSHRQKASSHRQIPSSDRNDVPQREALTGDI